MAIGVSQSLCIFCPGFALACACMQLFLILYSLFLFVVWGDVCPGASISALQKSPRFQPVSMVGLFPQKACGFFAIRSYYWYITIRHIIVHFHCIWSEIPGLEWLHFWKENGSNYLNYPDLQRGWHKACLWSPKELKMQRTLLYLKYLTVPHSWELLCRCWL